jgi:hypothetical protein
MLVRGLTSAWAFATCGTSSASWISHALVD